MPPALNAEASPGSQAMSHVSVGSSSSDVACRRARNSHAATGSPTCTAMCGNRWRKRSSGADTQGRPAGVTTAVNQARAGSFVIKRIASQTHPAIQSRARWLPADLGPRVTASHATCPSGTPSDVCLHIMPAVASPAASQAPRAVGLRTSTRFESRPSATAKLSACRNCQLAHGQIATVIAAASRRPVTARDGRLWTGQSRQTTTMAATPTSALIAPAMRRAAPGPGAQVAGQLSHTGSGPYIQVLAGPSSPG